MSKVRDLKVNDFFRTPTQRKFRQVKVIHPLGESGSFEAHRGKLLIILENCRQWVLDLETEIVIQ